MALIFGTAFVSIYFFGTFKQESISTLVLGLMLLSSFFCVIVFGLFIPVSMLVLRIFAKLSLTHAILFGAFSGFVLHAAFWFILAPIGSWSRAWELLALIAFDEETCWLSLIAILVGGVTGRSFCLACYELPDIGPDSRVPNAVP